MSRRTHGNFIVNDGSATAADIRRLIERCRTAVRDRFGVELREEIVYLGDFGNAASEIDLKPESMLELWNDRRGR